MVSSVSENYDLYYYDEPTHYWMNYKPDGQHSGFNIEPLKGYLYANASNVTLSFAGTLQPGITATSGILSYEAQSLKGWNLVGNPFPCNVYADKNYYVMNEDGTAIYPTPVSIGTAIAPCTGIMVKAEGQDETVTFSKEAPETQGQSNGMLQVTLSQSVEPAETPVNRGDGPSTLRQAQGSEVLTVDRAIVSFNQGDELGKFVFNKDNAMLYIPQNGEDYAIAFAEKQGEKPLNFKAKENGQYTISVNPENVEMNYLHLIDNITGADIDLLVPELVEGPASYTFTAKTTDYESRFRLVFSANGTSTGSATDETFAYYADGEIIIMSDVCDASIQVIDLMGRVVYQGDAINRVSTGGMVPSVYVLRLINGEDVKVQKVVIE